jgi:predicted DNA-binding protein
MVCLFLPTCTSIRLERELKDKLKEIAGNQGYQALIRDVLWNLQGDKMV